MRLAAGLLALCTCVQRSSALGLAHSSEDGVSEAPAHQRLLRYAAADVKPLDGADMRCLGDGELERACLITDLYYDTEQRTFRFHGSHISAAEAPANAADLQKAFQRETCARSYSSSVA